MSVITSKPTESVEEIKARSHFLRGTLVEGLADETTGSISEDDNKILKFHGSYQQDDRDLREPRRQQKLEPAWQFMIRARIAGGVVSPQQWLAFDEIATTWANHSLRITTRQTFQLHGVIKRHLKKTMAAINQALISTVAACGDVNRNVVSSANPVESSAHRLALEWASRLSEHLKPKTRAYHEIWLDGEPVVGGEPEQEPLYGPTYLPRKFKIGIAIPPTNDVDVFAQDLGLIAIIEEGRLQGFNVAVGGGMGTTHGDASTYPRLASIIGFVRPDQLLRLAEAVIEVQRDFGNRQVRKHARLKYTIDHRGLEWFVHEVEQRLGAALTASRPWHFEHNGDRFGWLQGDDGRWHLTLRTEAGRIADTEARPWLTGLREIARIHQGDFRMTCNQNLIIANVPADQRASIDRLVEQFGLTGYARQSGLRRNSVACVALPTCALAMAESERYLPLLLPRLEALLDKHGLTDAPIVFRLSGCPNGCSRPYLGEIALVGRGPGRYDLRLGADFQGLRLNRLFRENIAEPDILAELDVLLARYARERHEAEYFGDFLLRQELLPEAVHVLNVVEYA
ncbi:assimilatory sulfite reductase (NADPH) hemoprotein subunit [Frateuria aurantia]|uniref:Sulfite reductase [NADPH] hemoprotein beta-component n=1 Tax=Frateuria aurantia (strain ATCC 33424 / DSM 6220 / KCTC 2777 / LMG 1558 / NBRC 3245 / NCIMB 13370) TaxID=767434 RepID=H8L1Z6_FRAAD|nr:assimilatory sulfite reductase (NADPH) hemoprotein subunit [Frateuria aurantia]AFC87251.1 sulfite reductase (NADPH) hemoprotein, beta-component [Frateuria aurantia DSM 6220]